ncbi:plasminogen receptor (KT) [Oenanthe melanoleuca]|uniref:plasminogen receptor (KT) n=1 Tax=Oenanthe melanoleuca TaxID=2939378 RepID=UPI0024C14C41|nr:plasminogen receptor (KT) [Oenanthe melanoleuca]
MSSVRRRDGLRLPAAPQSRGPAPPSLPGSSSRPGASSGYRLRFTAFRLQLTGYRYRLQVTVCPGGAKGGAEGRDVGQAPPGGGSADPRPALPARRHPRIPRAVCSALQGAMGFVVSKAMNDSLKGQQEFMRLQLERQLILQNLMRERQTAMQIAWTREFLKYFGTFFGLAAVVLTTGAVKRKNPAVLLPILPLSFVFSYQYDMGYGTLLQRIKGEAENILDTQSSLLELPKGPLTFEDLEKIRISQSNFFTEK